MGRIRRFSDFVAEGARALSAADIRGRTFYHNTSPERLTKRPVSWHVSPV